LGSAYAIGQTFSPHATWNAPARCIFAGSANSALSVPRQSSQGPEVSGTVASMRTPARGGSTAIVATPRPGSGVKVSSTAR
jgi:hypothetical protein